MTLNYIFGKPKYLVGIGEIFPIRLNDLDEFNEVSGLLYISRNHFESNNIPLLDLLFLSADHLKTTKENIVLSLEKLFSLVLRKDVFFVVDKRDDDAISRYSFFIDEHHSISNKNYDELRQIVMKQNLMFEQKVFKDKIVQEWANKVIEAKSKNSAKITTEDIITTVSVYKGIDYDKLKDYTIYQLYADFYRVRKIKKHESDIIFRSVSDKVTIEDFAEEIQMFKNPYDDLFVSKSKLSKLNNVMGEQG